MLFRRVFGSALVLASLLGGRLAAAAPSDAEKETARSLMDDGDRLRAAQDFKSALQRYQAAHEIMKVPTTGVEVAKTHALLGQLVEARRTAIEVANLPVLDGEASVMGQARQEASALAAELATRIPSALIQVWPREAQASILVDSVQLPQAAQGLPYKANPGEHVVQVSAPGYQTAEQRFTLQEGTQTTVAINLIADPNAPVAVAPAAASPAPAAAPAASQTTPPAEATPASEPETSNTNAYVAFGIAGAGALVGSVTGFMSLNKASSAKEHCDGDVCTPEAADDIDSSKSLATFSNIGFAVALAAGAWGLYEVLSEPDAPAPAKAGARGTGPHITLAFTLDQAAASLWGSF